MPLDIIEGFQGAAFGLSDGVICISGMIIGACVATWDSKVVMIAALTGGLADALGNAIGFYLSELTERGVQIHDRSHGGNSSIHSKHEVLVSGILSFSATFFVLALFLSPFLFLGMGTSLWVIFTEAIIVMLILGVYVGKLSGESPTRTAVKYALLAVTGAGFSYLVGEMLQIYLLSLSLT
jgi:predicted membrane protein (TIGR00267 family)